MSSSFTFSLLSCLLIFSLLPILSSAGRPCKALFVSYYTVTTTTVSSDPTTHHLSGPTSRFYAFYRIVPLPILPQPVHVDRPAIHRGSAIHRRSAIPNRLGITSASLQDRAKDILIVVAGLLFGLGCGAVTAATMYLVWSMVTANHHEIYDESSSDEEESPKKMGYVKIAAAEPVKDATKEGYEGN